MSTAGDRPTVGDRIERARKKRGWTQAELAAEIGCSASWIKRVEAGDELPLGSRYTGRLAHVLQLNFDEPDPVQPTADNDWDLSKVPEAVILAELVRREAVRAARGWRERTGPVEPFVVQGLEFEGDEEVVDGGTGPA